MRTSRDYKKYIRPTGGFNPEVINELAKKLFHFLKWKDMSPYSLMK